MGNNQRVVIFIVIGVFMVSVFGSAIFLLSSSDTDGRSDAVTAAELAQQADDIQAAEQQQAEVQTQATSCRSVQTESLGSAKELPAYDLPSSDVLALETIDLVEGTGREAKAGDCVVAYYHGTLTDGTIFDSAYERGQPLPFSLNGVIQGWSQGIPGMREGGVRVLNIPSDLGYGTDGNGDIPPNSDLVFVVELVEVVEI